ncbi:sulfatase [Labilibacter sediminis]|nr:sulfatase [Labilibacter sediminis]
MKFLGLLIVLFSFGFSVSSQEKPNILFIMSDDHTSQAISAYCHALSEIFQTPNIDRIADEGMLFNNCFVTNSICTPSRATILTGQYSQHNGVYTLKDPLVPEHNNIAKILQKEGYKTGVIGKWHLKSEPTGFDYYNVLSGQGRYKNPMLKEKGEWQKEGKPFVKCRGVKHKGYSTDVVGQLALDFLKEYNKKEPFMLMCHFKAPHRPWTPAKRFENMFDGVSIPEPASLYEDHSERSEWATQTYNTISRDLKRMDLGVKSKEDTLSGIERTRWAYQIYMKRYLACCAAVDENVGKLLDFLEESGLSQNTIVVYTGDQGFFLGEHGWFDKRLMMEETLKMPLLVKYPEVVKTGSVSDELVSNVDFAPTLLDYAGVNVPEDMDGKSMKRLLSGKKDRHWRDAFYYRYWMHLADHGIPAHYGIRTDRYKLVFYYGRGLGMSGTDSDRIDPFNRDSGPIVPTKPEWELYDLKKDPNEMNNLYGNPKYTRKIQQLKEQLLELKRELGDEDTNYPAMNDVITNYWN